MAEERCIHRSGKGGPTLLARSWLPLPHPEEEEEGRSPEWGGTNGRRKNGVVLQEKEEEGDEVGPQRADECFPFLHALKVIGLRVFLSERNDHFANL